MPPATFAEHLGTRYPNPDAVREVLSCARVLIRQRLAFAAAEELDLVRCPRCSQDLPRSAFGVAAARPSGLQGYCRACRSAKAPASASATLTDPDRTPAATVTVSALLYLPDVVGLVHLALPLSPLQSADVHELPAFASAPSAFLPLTFSVLIGEDARTLTVAVFRTSAPEVFLAVPFADDIPATRAHADTLRGWA